MKDAEICGGDGSIGWAATIVDIYPSDRPGIISRTVQDFKRKMAQYFNVPLRKIKQISRGEYEAYADSQLETMASMAKVPKEKVRIISKDEYEENTEEE